jgi:hypothetical protein
MEYKIRSKLVIVCLVGLLGACGQQATPTPEAPAPHVEMKSMPQDPVAPFKVPSKRYVAAVNGLHLRSEGRADAEIIATLPYGTPLEAHPNKSGDMLIVDHLRGAMWWVELDGQQGYAFSGFLSALPMPVRPGGNVNRWEAAKQYVDSLKQLGLSATFSLEDNNDGGKDATLRIPASNIHEAFLIAKASFSIPEDYHFPLEKKVTLSTPANPSKAAKASPYSDCTHSFSVVYASPDSVEEVIYHDDNEVGGKSISIKRQAGDWRIYYHGWAH